MQDVSLDRFGTGTWAPDPDPEVATVSPANQRDIVLALVGLFLSPFAIAIHRFFTVDPLGFRRAAGDLFEIVKVTGGVITGAPFAGTTVLGGRSFETLRATDGFSLTNSRAVLGVAAPTYKRPLRQPTPAPSLGDRAKPPSPNPIAMSASAAGSGAR